ncbi:hypothetical protein ATANTOWER_006089 [Ataeniobius toweri]|uniref:Uncharacterized protein n=1 Tax=Ataeniobius toweri TaxID=208326 RepID=A0ABU7B7Q7_9TELE|nr:hypothetical protein [Ataeniobius toweri]
MKKLMSEHSPSYLTELELFCKDSCAKYFSLRYAKLVEKSQRSAAVKAQSFFDDSGGLNANTCYIFQILFMKENYIFFSFTTQSFTIIKFHKKHVCNGSMT